MSNYTGNLFDRDGRTALITGRLRGIGLHLAEALGSAGAKLMLTARKEKKADRSLWIVYQ